MKDVMAFTQDLIQCVANDVAEARLEEGGEAAAGVTSQDLASLEFQLARKCTTIR